MTVGATRGNGCGRAGGSGEPDEEEGDESAEEKRVVGRSIRAVWDPAVSIGAGTRASARVREWRRARVREEANGPWAGSGVRKERPGRLGRLGPRRWRVRKRGRREWAGERGRKQPNRKEKRIIQHGQCDLLEVTAERNTVLHIAAQKGHVELIQEMYHRFIKDNAFSLVGTQHWTHLSIAHRECDQENILACENASGDTALHLAARHDHGAAVEALVAVRATASELNKAGVSPFDEQVLQVNTCRKGDNYLMPGCILCRSELAKSSARCRLPELGLIWLTFYCNGSQNWPAKSTAIWQHASTPLHFAASDGNRSVVRLILRIVPPSTVYIKDSYGLSALHVAARMGHANVVQKIIKKFPDAEELRDGHGETFLHAAAREKHSSVVSLAIKNSKQWDLLNTQDKHGNTSLHLAVVAGAPSIVDALVQTNVLNDDGHTPLDLASTSTILFNMESNNQAYIHYIKKPKIYTHLNLCIDIVLPLLLGFNMPGSYGDDGTANLKSKLTFKTFMILETLAIATSVIAVILLIYGRCRALTRTWKSFTIALNFMSSCLARSDHHDPQQQQQRAAGSANSADGELEMCPSLYRAARRGRAKEVMALLLQPRQHGHGIVQQGQCDLLEMTVERNTIFHIAAEQGHGELIQELFHRIPYWTPLHCAARAGHLSAVNALLNLAKDCGENTLGCQSRAGDTSLHLAATHGHGAVVEALVSARRSASELNKAGMSALYLAVMSRSVIAVRAIVTTCLDASSVGPSSQNALHAAVFQSLEMVQLLLQWKPELASQVDGKGSTPLHFAASNGSHSVVRAILQTATPSTIYMKDSDGLSAIHVAARMGHAGVVKEIIEVCPDAAEQLDGNAGTFVHAAAREKHSSVVSLVVKEPRLGGLLNAQDGDGNTPLHLAVLAGELGVVGTLLRKGKVRTGVLNNAGDTPLDLASKSTSFFTMISLVLSLVAFRAQGRPQRLDHLEPWRGRDIAQGIEKCSDSLALVAVLIATVAFTAGFNMPGGYRDDGRANLQGVFAFNVFMVLDAIAVATSVVAVILLVYGKASRSVGSWQSFVVALHCIWISLLSLILAFYFAGKSVTTSRAIPIVFFVIYMCIYFLIIWIQGWFKAAWTVRGVWMIRHHAHAIKRQYPFAITSLTNLRIFAGINIIVFLGLSAIYLSEGIRSIVEQASR
uniref:PGG domain-containing protein n=1 Tax=Leersia perrieri TaxID=77586 RepID=A0A0D9XPR4_9ORYZ